MSNFLETALDLARRGFKVLRLIPRDKWPLVAGGYKAGTTDADQLELWWRKTPTANVGIAAGRSDLVVMDADHGLASYEDFIAWRDRNGLPPTYTVYSGRRPEYGAQMYYQRKGGITTQGRKTFKLDGVTGDFKSEGGLVVHPPSIHPVSGEAYELVLELPIAECPELILNLPTAAGHEKSNGQPNANGLIEGNRNEDMCSLIGQLRYRTRIDEDAMLALMLQVNETRYAKGPMPEEEVKTIVATQYRLYSNPEPVGEVVIGSSKANGQTEPLEIAEKQARPVFPDDAWADTAFGEFAEIVCHGSYIRKRLASESFRAITGAIAGDQVTCGIAGVRMREYHAIIANRQSGKSYGMDCAVWFYTRQSPRCLFEPMLMVDCGQNSYRVSGIGAQRFLPGSSNSFVDELTREKKHKKGEDVDVMLGPMWKPTARLITIQGEAMALFSRLCSPDWTGQALSALVTDLYDSLDAEVAVTKDRTTPKIPVQLQYSMLLCTQPQIWRKYMASHMMDSGLFGRFYIVGSEYKPIKVLLPDYSDSELFQEHFGALRRDVFGRLDHLRDHPMRMTIAPEAKGRLQDWENALPDDGDLDRDLTSRMGLHVWRAAMARAWGAIPQRTAITLEDADAAIRLGEYQVKMRQYYAPTSGDSPRWRHLNAVRDAIEQAGQITIRDLRRAVRGDRFPEDFDWALAYLEKRGQITIIPGKRKDQRIVAWVLEP